VVVLFQLYVYRHFENVVLFCFQLFSKLQATKQEIVDLQEANARERQELEQTQNELTRELKLKFASSSLLSSLFILLCSHLTFVAYIPIFMVFFCLLMSFC